jgi:hypothetical protein
VSVTGHSDTSAEGTSVMWPVTDTSASVVLLLSYACE